MSFLSGVKNFFGNFAQGLAIGTGVAQQFEPEISAIPTAGPIIVTGLNIVLALERIFQQPGLGPQKLALAVPALVSSHPGITETQAISVINSIVAGLNAAAGAIPPPASK